MFIRKALVSAMGGIALSFASLSASADNVLLKTPIAFSSNLPALGSPIVKVADQLKLISGGSLKMKIYEPGKLVPPLQILDAVSSGKVNSGYATAGYWKGKMKAASLFSSVPFGPEAGEYMAWMYYGNGLDLYQEMYDSNGYNVKVLPCAILSPETSGWYSKPINKPEDLKGLNLRYFGLGAAVLENLGAGTVQLPGGEIFGALEKGVIDGAEYSQPAIDKRLGLHKIVKYNYFPGWHQQATVFELLINKNTWAKMDQQQQAIVETTCKASVADSIAEGEASQHAEMKTMRESGVKHMYWSQEMLDTFEASWKEVAAEYSNDDAFFNKVWADMSAFRNGYDLWERYAFLPRKSQ